MDFKYNRLHIRRANFERANETSDRQWDAYQALTAVIDAIECLRPLYGAAPTLPVLVHQRNARGSRRFGPEDAAVEQANEEAMRAYREQCLSTIGWDPRSEVFIRMALERLERVLLMRLPLDEPKPRRYCAEFLASIHEPQDPENQRNTNN